MIPVRIFAIVVFGRVTNLKKSFSNSRTGQSVTFSRKCPRFWKILENLVSAITVGYELTFFTENFETFCSRLPVLPHKNIRLNKIRITRDGILDSFFLIMISPSMKLSKMSGISIHITSKKYSYMRKCDWSGSTDDNSDNRKLANIASGLQWACVEPRGRESR